MKKIKIGFRPGIVKTMTVDDNITITEALDLFQVETEKSMLIDGFEIRNDGQLTTDYNTAAGDTIFAVKEIKGASEEMPDLGTESREALENTNTDSEESKKADLFTKEFVENASLEVLSKEALLHWIDVVKIRNKYIQARRAEMLGVPKRIEVMGKLYETEIIVTSDGRIRIQSVEEIPYIGYFKFDGLQGESDVELIKRFNSTAI